MTREEAFELEDEKTCCHCPYCNGSLTTPMPFCKGCGAELRFCSQCSQPLPKKAQVCPHCGAEVY
ncbi:MAG: zinc ribbon domain-containing protein [Anaerolineales bacterium]|nr:zinc ribbon domain-containing protein [Anaerolineales bacterium]